MPDIKKEGLLRLLNGFDKLLFAPPDEQRKAAKEMLSIVEETCGPEIAKESAFSLIENATSNIEDPSIKATIEGAVKENAFSLIESATNSIEDSFTKAALEGAVDFLNKKTTEERPSRHDVQS